MQHLIIGAGPAGVVAAETLRKCDPDCDIAIIGDEPEPPYSRMAIPYYLIDNIEESGTYLRDPSARFTAQNIEVVQQKVGSVDTSAKTVTLADGSSRAYDKLLIATGSNPVSPPIPGLDLPQVSSCWTLEDSRTIIKLAQPGSNVVLIGAGFIGCIILEALVKRGVHQVSSRPPALSSSMRGTMRLPISTTARFTPRLTSASRMMQPMKPAPISTTLEPDCASLTMLRASSSVQQECTCGRSSPGIGGLIGCEPVATSSLS